MTGTKPLQVQGVNRRLRNPVPAGKLTRLSTSLVLPKNPDDLLFRKSRSLHPSVLSWPDSRSEWRKKSEAGQFRPALETALAYTDGAKGGRPAYDAVAMFKVLILAAQNTVSDARMEFLIRDRLSWAPPSTLLITVP